MLTLSLKGGPVWFATSAQQGCLKQSCHEYKLVSVLLSHAETEIPVNPVKLQEISCADRLLLFLVEKC